MREPRSRARDPRESTSTRCSTPRRSRPRPQLWSLQGRGSTWFCGAYFGSGFHEDGLQAGLAVAEALGDVRRPWNVADESGVGMPSACRESR